MNPISRGIRNAFRNVIRTFSLVIILGLSVGLSLVMLIAHQAVGDKITSVKASVGNTVSISPAGFRGGQGGGNALTDSQLASVRTLPHVTGVEEGLSDRLTASDTNLVSAVSAGTLGQRFSQNSGQTFTPPPGGGFGGKTGTVNFTPPVTVNGTTNPTDLTSTLGGGTFTLSSGSVFSPTSADNVALLGTNLASKNNLKVGSTFTAYNTTIQVIGIFSAGNTFSDNQLLMPLATLQKLAGEPGAITNAVLSVDSITNVTSVTNAVAKTLGSAADVTNASAQAQTAIQPLQNIQSISLYSLAGAVGAGAIIILLTMVMIVRERRREIGVLKAIGASNLKVMGQFMVEAITLTVLGSIIGIVLGFIAGNPITHLLVTSSASSPAGGGFRGGRLGIARNISTVQAAIGWTIILDGLAAAIIIALIGSALASFFIAKIRPAEVMRVE